MVRRVKKVGNFHIFAATVSRDTAERRLIETGKLPPPKDVEEAEKTRRKLSRKE